MKDVASTTPQNIEENLKSTETSRSASVQSHHRTTSSLSTYSSVSSRTSRQIALPPQPTRSQTTPLKASDVIPRATYMERGQRWMEKEEAVSLRDALEDMDLKNEDEARIHAAAQNEASELVFQHQNPQAVPQQGAPYSYREHLRKNSYQHARSASVGRSGSTNKITGLARDMSMRSVSGGSTTSTGMETARGRMSMDSYDVENPKAEECEQDKESRPARKPYGSMTTTTRPLNSRRRSSAKRNISGEISGAFTGEQIWEEPEQETERGRTMDIPEEMPAPLRVKARNPLDRVQGSSDTINRSSSTPPESTKRLSLFDIHKNPPTQSRDPNYTHNPLPLAAGKDSEPKAEEDKPKIPMKDGLEIRGDDIKQATSMLLRDRSPKLPTPTAVSDTPGRPIVSFDSNWKPKEADEKPEVRRRSPFDRYNTSKQRQSLPSGQAKEDITTTVQVPHTSGSAANKVISTSDRTVAPPTSGVSRPPIPSIQQTRSAPTIPHINPPDSPSVPTTNSSFLPIINFPDSTPPMPSINLLEQSTSAPTINFPDSSPSTPSINISTAPTVSISPAPDTRRPLPPPRSGPNKMHQRPLPAPRGHWSPVAGKRATATCHQCQLPIEGRVVKMSGSPENFHPQCFICFCCGTGLESLEIRPEPSAHREQRIDRIRRRAHGEQLPEVEGQTYAEDGDERLRFYCHLDWHENFAPRCKHCKTPIMEEHLVALGEHWHYGHFFCAECGDPFEKGVSHIEKDGYAWCISCQTKRTERRAPKCKKCRQPVIGEYVQALGGEWHDKCFRCVTCNGGFDDGAFFPKTVGTQTVVLCTGCIERELKA